LLILSPEDVKGSSLPCLAHSPMELWDAREKIWPSQHAVPVVFAFMIWMFYRCIERNWLNVRIFCGSVHGFVTLGGCYPTNYGNGLNSVSL